MRSEKYSIIKQKKRKKIFETVLSIFILFAIFFGVLTGYYGSKLMSFLNNISDGNDNHPETIENTRQLEDLEPFSALILGIDVEEEGKSRSDTIIVVTVNPDSEDMKMVSIPRDTLVTLPNGVEEKINAAYSAGGAMLTKEMISSYLDIPIQFYATMDFDGLIELVDAVGGITVESNLDFTENNYRNSKNPVHIVEGKQTLNGEEALAYARMRKVDPAGDFGRQKRQQEVIIAILKKLASFNTVTNLTAILNSVEPYLSTNATGPQMISIASSYSNAIGDIDQLALDGLADSTFFPHYGFEVWTWEPYEESLFTVQNELKKHLGLEISEVEFNRENQFEENQLEENGYYEEESQPEEYEGYEEYEEYPEYNPEVEVNEPAPVPVQPVQ